MLFVKIIRRFVIQQQKQPRLSDPAVVLVAYLASTDVVLEVRTPGMSRKAFGFPESSMEDLYTFNDVEVIDAQQDSKTQPQSRVILLQDVK
jgi:hypothetical protein